MLRGLQGYYEAENHEHRGDGGSHRPIDQSLCYVRAGPMPALHSVATRESSAFLNGFWFSGGQGYFRDLR
jgi:hypothetical protein